MRSLTSGEIVVGLAVITLVELVLFGLALLSILIAARDAVQENHRKTRIAAASSAERMARRRVREILSSIRITAPVELINESDIDWGEEGRR